MNQKNCYKIKIQNLKTKFYVVIVINLTKKIYNLPKKKYWKHLLKNNTTIIYKEVFQIVKEFSLH